MTFYDLAEKIERSGCVGNRGQTVYGTAAVLHVLALRNLRIDDLDYTNLEKAKRFVDCHKAEPVKC